MADIREKLNQIEERHKRFKPFMEALGFVASTWAEYETTLNMRIWELANVDRVAGTCMTSQLIGPGPRFRCFLALLEFRQAPQPLIDAYNSHSRKAHGVAGQRNRYLHDPLMLDDESGEIVRMELTADKHVKHELIATEVAELKRLHHKISELMRDFDELWDQVLTEVPSWPRVQFETSSGIRLNRRNE